MVGPRHSKLRRLLEYWIRKKAGRFAPARRDIEPAEMRDLLPNVFLMDVEKRPTRFRLRLMGTDLVRSFGLDLTGRYIDELDFSDRPPSALACYTAVVTTREPSCHGEHFTRGNGRHLSYERLILPLSSDGATIDMLLGGACFDEAYETRLPSAARRARG